jgi:hypothetical protein
VTGYLQRLAAGVAKSNGTIHPVVPPLYSNPLAEIGGEPPQLPVDATRSAVPDLAPRADRQAEHTPPHHWPESPVARVAWPHANRRAPVPRAAGQAARVPHSLADPAVSEAWPLADVRPDAVRSAPATGAGLGTIDETPETRSRLVDRRSEPLFAPLLVAPAPIDQVADAAGPEQLDFALAALAPVTRRAAGLPARSRAAEPNDVAIHIGRIEVTAVQPAPVPAPPKPPRRAPSLDEYLKRRNGGRL